MVFICGITMVTRGKRRPQILFSLIAAFQVIVFFLVIIGKSHIKLCLWVYSLSFMFNIRLFVGLVYAIFVLVLWKETLLFSVLRGRGRR